VGSLLDELGLRAPALAAIRDRTLPIARGFLASDQFRTWLTR
jgi:hypothetical protein